MKGSIKIQVSTEGAGGQKTPVTDARVVLGLREHVGDSAWPHDFLLPTHGHLSGGFYGLWVSPTKDLLVAGEYLLVVQKKGMSPVVQRLTLVMVDNVLQVKPGWGRPSGTLADQAATVSIVNVGKPAGKPASGSQGPPQHSTVNVLLLPRFEVVGVASHNHLDHTKYRPFCNGRRNLLVQTGVVNKAAIFTHFECDERARVIYVKSAKADAASFVEVERVIKHPLDADKGKKRPSETYAHEYGILDFYGHLNDLGNKHPGTVVEAGIFGHGWIQGPLIWDTWDTTTSTTERTADDLDGRQKDWLPEGQTSITATGSVNVGPTMKAFASIKAAFASAPAQVPDKFLAKTYAPGLRVWGCVHMNNIVLSIRGAYQHLTAKPAIKRNEFFVTQLHGGRESTTLDHVKRHLALFAMSKRYLRMVEHGDFRGAVGYAGAAARILSPVRCYAAPPGLGSSYRTLGGHISFRVDDEQTISSLDPDGKKISGLNENYIPYKYYRAEFGAFFVEDVLNYVDYAKWRTVESSLPDPGWSPKRWATFHDGGQRAAVLRLASGLEVHAKGDPAKKKAKAPALSVFATPKDHTVAGIKGQLFPFVDLCARELSLRGGSRVLIVTAAKKDEPRHAVFVGDDGRTLLLTDNGKNVLTVSTTALPIHTPTFAGLARWGDPQADNGTVSGGELEKVSPKWFW